VSLRPSPVGPVVDLRPARADDLPACLDIWHAALDDYGRRVGRPPMPRSFGQLTLLAGQALATDPERFWVAVRSGHEQVVGFVSAIVRGPVWYLALLFVRPGYQAAGLGRAMLERVLPAPGQGLVLATCTDSAQPIANALYATLGIVPRVPVLQLVGRPERSPLPDLPSGIRAVSFAEIEAGDVAGGGAASALLPALDTLDRAVLGYERPLEHVMLRRSGRRGYLYRSDGDRVVGYGYVADSGRLGPVALEDPDLAPAVLGQLTRAIDPPGAFLAWLPGSFGQATVALLRAGFRLEDFPALLCWDRDFARFDRYLPLSLAIL
jgi:GNAT superfamily N-acetyltransferase